MKNTSDILKNCLVLVKNWKKKNHLKSKCFDLPCEELPKKNMVEIF